MTGRQDALSAALDNAAEAAEAGAQEQRQTARAARALAHRRNRGATATDLKAPLLAFLAVFTTSAQRLAATAGAVRRAWVGTLLAEGLSTRQVGSFLGVSHQRISVLLRETHPDGVSRGGGQRRHATER